MAASGTNKKITVGELVTDSALTGAFWPNSTTALAGSGVADADKLPILDGTVAKYIEASELAQATQFSSRYLQTGATALTGANLANGDKFGVVDVGSPDVVKTITADELAQGSQFSSRYAPRVEAIWVPANPFVQTSGSAAAASSVDVFQCVTLGDSAIERIVLASVIIPTHWTSAIATVWWFNNTANAGDVNLRGAAPKSAGPGDALPSFGNENGVIVTAAAQNVIVATALGSARPVTGGEVVNIALARQGNDASDTLTGTIGVLGVSLARA
jgi:hypothetical protein